MRYFLFSIAVLFITLQSAAQQPKWDSTFRPGSYALKVDQFRSYPNSRKDIIFLGNSITAGADWNELLGLPQARNRGISGDITYGVLERLDEVTAGKPAKVFVLIGINDMARSIPDSVILSNYEKIIHRIRKESPTTRIYFNTLLPVNNSFPDKNHFNKDEHIAALNAGLRKIAAREKITLIDIHDHFLDKDKKLDKQYTYDGLHLNAAGYTHWASLLKPHIAN
ncbi:GDSL-type esterase/lipase family protein [Terrimonas ferruginea]|uniref:GDSL-type esterase/lipase family protein n=1 Tax=Terrimonas ferruginea TaxID=249 RepID=UPI0004160679|nr:GDSL-type esterase/lipase family protein [Terrimonas ferruginea]